MSTVLLFIDTNVFIQLRDLKDIPWRKLFRGVKHVRIMVARVVVDELDKHKVSNKPRQRDRARAALKLIGQARKAPSSAITLRDTPVKVTLEIPKRAKLDWEWLSMLDPSEPDDRLVAEAATFGNDAAILSHDSGPLLSAHDVGLKNFEPLDDWHLPDEQSEADKRISLLERQLSAAKATKPKLDIQVEGTDKTGELSLYRPILPALSESQVARLAQRYIDEYPRASPRASDDLYALTMLDGITKAQVSSYHGKYHAFEEKVNDFLRRLHEYSYYLVVPNAVVTIFNSGSVSARDFHVTLETSGDLNLLASAKQIRKVLRFPEPPEVPRAHDYLGRLHNLSRSIPAPPHPTEIVWIDKPGAGDSYGRYGCQDFQPERSYRRTVSVWPVGEIPVKGTLKVTAGANDVADISSETKVTIKDRSESWQSARVVKSLPEFLQEELKALK